MPFPHFPFPSPGLYPGGSGPFTDGVAASLAPWNDSEGNWYNLIVALGAMFEQVYSLVADFGSPDVPATYQPGWSVLLDPVNCPTAFLPFQATFVGAPVPANTDDATARAIITQEAGQQRGTPAAIISAAQRNLTGTQSVALFERVPDPYSFRLVVRSEECQNPAAFTAAVNAVKPAGVVWQLVETVGWTISQMESSAGSLSALEALFGSVLGLENDQLGY